MGILLGVFARLCVYVFGRCEDDCKNDEDDKYLDQVRSYFSVKFFCFVWVSVIFFLNFLCGVGV